MVDKPIMALPHMPPRKPETPPFFVDIKTMQDPCSFVVVAPEVLDVHPTKIFGIIWISMVGTG